ncbi:hypothetical protein Pmani_016522 [Petrolisthes manimaculis]|uniref:Uncharacterized protein n=1 Tax=Petrolisthes manimaculis TaxID=1843537 RepID=A0AAE1PRG5_9EUCA|nr:hypothetical protein Pmani_016522 [Petrolisthes manimaculis]
MTVDYTEQVGSTSNCEIFREVTRHHQHGAAVSFSSVERSILRAKRRIQPRQPHTAEECANILESPEAEAVNGNLRAVVREQESDAIKNVERLDADMDITRHKREKICRNIEHRQNFKEKLQNRNYTLVQYINDIVYTFDSSASQFILPRDSYDEGGDEQHGLDNIDDEEFPHELRCSICLRRRERTVALMPCRHASLCAMLVVLIP